MMNNNTVDQVCFSRRITKEEATELVLAGWYNVMCLGMAMVRLMRMDFHIGLV